MPRRKLLLRLPRLPKKRHVRLRNLLKRQKRKKKKIVIRPVTIRMTMTTTVTRRR